MSLNFDVLTYRPQLIVWCATFTHTLVVVTEPTTIDRRGLSGFGGFFEFFGDLLTKATY